MRRRKFFAASIATVAMLAAAVPVRAQDADDQKRAVARISLMDGQVSVRRGDSGDWVAGILNAPLMAGDQIATAPNSRAEIQLDAANMIRLGGNAEIHLTGMEYGRYQMEFGKGTLTYRVLRPSNANVEVDTPNVSVRPSRVGVYRISVNESGETEVTSRAGDVEVFTPKGSQWINAGQTMMARGSASDPEFQIVGAIPVDDWDRWNETRDRIFLQVSPSAQYIDPSNSGVYGTEELDANGSWVNDPTYGNVWHPTAVGSDWAPYSAGRWVWEDWYGWTWVSYDPWGWAPYHYGRWFWGPRWGWCWYPGAWGARHFWSPALVGWFGWGGGAGFGFGFGHVGWVPLAPFEAIHPWWGRGVYGNFGRNINVTNVNITNVYRNARVVNGVSGMTAGDFRSGHFNSISRVPSAQIQSAGLVRGQMPIGPSSANLHFAGHEASFRPQVNQNQRFFSHQQMSAPQRIPFAQQQRAMGIVEPAATRGGAAGLGNRPAVSGTPGRSFGNTAGSASPAPPRQSTAAPETNTRPGGSTGWRRFGEPATQNPNVGAARPQAQSQSNNGWNRFGNPGSASPNRSPQGSQPSYSQPRYNAPASQPRSNSQPSYSAPRSSPAPSYSAPRSAPSYSAPRGGGGGGSGSRSSGGGGGGHSGGGGHHR